MPSVIPVIVNATAGKGQTDEEIARIEALFRSVDTRVEVMPARTGGELRKLAERTAATKPQIMVAGGGDGTINCVASVVAGTGIALGVLPLGTLNHFAKDLRTPLEPQEAARTIAEGRVIEVDVGEVNGKVFLNNSSLGLYPHIVVDREHQQRLGRGKWPAFLWATLTALRRSPFLDVRVSLDDQEKRYLTTFVFIGNNKYVMEGFDIGARQRIDEGRLSLYVSQGRGRGGLFALAIRALFGRLKQARDFHALTAQTIAIATRHRQLQVATDGEVTIMQTPLEYRIRSRALRVIVPAPQEGKP